MRTCSPTAFSPQKKPYTPTLHLPFWPWVEIAHHHFPLACNNKDNALATLYHAAQRWPFRVQASRKNSTASCQRAMVESRLPGTLPTARSGPEPIVIHGVIFVLHQWPYKWVTAIINPEKNRVVTLLLYLVRGPSLLLTSANDQLTNG